MFIETATAKGNRYIYLRSYSVKQYCSKNVETLYRFGRKEIAIQRLNHWREHFEDFPKELLELGCTWNHLDKWIQTIETSKTN